MLRISESTRWTLRTVAGERVFDSAVTHFCTSAWETLASFTLSHLGRMCSRMIPAYRSWVDGLRWVWLSSQCVAQSPTVIRASTESTKDPVFLDDSTFARNRSASALRLKVLLRCSPDGVR
jgi:hypothetical protein